MNKSPKSRKLTQKFSTFLNSKYAENLKKYFFEIFFSRTLTQAKIGLTHTSRWIFFLPTLTLNCLSKIEFQSHSRVINVNHTKFWSRVHLYLKGILRLFVCECERKILKMLISFNQADSSLRLNSSQKAFVKTFYWAI